jgi:membrane associated rhomboid family serine protease/Zn-finger nucleic acid-binding protein
MLVCPKCQGRLNQATTGLGHVFHCPQCDGRTAALAVVRQAAGKRYVSQLLERVRGGEGVPGRPCPSCAKKMVEIPADPKQPHPLLDLCLECQLVWFDRAELELLPRAPSEEEVALAVAPAAREAMALPDVAAIEPQAADQQTLALPTPEEAVGGAFGGQRPGELWKWVPGFMGMPIEHEKTALGSLPLVTWGLVATIVVTTLLTLNNLKEVVDQYGLIPAQWDRHGGLTLLTSFFLHGGLFHLIGNAYFLLIFGDNVEDYLGRFRYVLLVALAALAGDVVHILLDQNATLPTVGASGGISGVITYYALRFPRARLGVMLRFWLLFKWLHMPAYAALILWFALQLYGVAAQVFDISHVSSLAHLGGAGVGLLFWLLWRDR